MPDLLLEIGTYELSPGVLSSLAEDFSLRIRGALAENGLREDGIRVLYTLRRLAFIASNLVYEHTDEEDASDIISRSLTDVMTGLATEQATGQEGSPIGSISQINSLVCLYGEEVVPLCIGKVCAGRITGGHWRVGGEKELALPSVADYEDILASASVVIDVERRKEMVRDAIAVAARETKSVAQIDDALLSEIALCTEFPQPVRGELGLHSTLPMAFADASLREVSFVRLDSGDAGKMHFVGFADGPVKEDIVRTGFERVAQSALRGCQVLFARDREISLADHVHDLRGISDHAQCGSLWEKTERLRALSGEIARVVGAAAETVDRVAFLSQADLSTQIVRAFPGLHGVAGAAYALLDGEDPRVCTGIEEAALGGLNNGRITSKPEGFAVAIASRYDDLTSHLLAGRDINDPLVTKQASALIGLMIDGKLDTDLVTLLSPVREQFRILDPKMRMDELQGALRTCLEDGLTRHLETEQGISTRIISALPREMMGSAYRSSLCAQALQEASEKEGFLTLLATIAKLKAPPQGGKTRAYDPALFETESERSLWREYLKAEGKVGTLLAQLDYEGAIEHLALLGEVIDRYLKDIDLHIQSDEVRKNRLGLMSSFVDLYACVGNLDVLFDDRREDLAQAKRRDDK